VLRQVLENCERTIKVGAAITEKGGFLDACHIVNTQPFIAKGGTGIKRFPQASVLTHLKVG